MRPFGAAPGNGPHRRRCMSRDNRGDRDPVGTERAASIEPKPAEPEESGSEQGHRQVVGRHIICPVPSALPQDNGADQGRRAGRGDSAMMTRLTSWESTESGGVIGILATGLFASKVVNPGGADGLFFGNPGLFGIQLLVVAVTTIFSIIGTFVILKLVDSMTGLRVSSEEEATGLDLSQHNERAYS